MESVPEDLGLEVPEDVPEVPEDVPEAVPEVVEVVPEEVPEVVEEPVPAAPEPPKRGRGRPRKEPAAAPAAPKAAPKPKKQALVQEEVEVLPQPPQPPSIEQQFENIMYLFKQREIEERQRTSEKYKRMLGL